MAAHVVNSTFDYDACLVALQLTKHRNRNLLVVLEINAIAMIPSVSIVTTNRKSAKIQKSLSKPIG